MEWEEGQRRVYIVRDRGLGGVEDLECWLGEGAETAPNGSIIWVGLGEAVELKARDFRGFERSVSDLIGQGEN